jgi:hypothetical protein
VQVIANFLHPLQVGSETFFCQPWIDCLQEHRHHYRNTFRFSPRLIALAPLLPDMAQRLIRSPPEHVIMLDCLLG